MAKKKMGRPRVPVKDRKIAPILFRVEPAVHAALETYREKEMPVAMSELVYLLVREGMKRRKIRVQGVR